MRMPVCSDFVERESRMPRGPPAPRQRLGPCRRLLLERIALMFWTRGELGLGDRREPSAGDVRVLRFLLQDTGTRSLAADG